MNGYDDLDEQAVADLTGGTYSPEAQRMDRLRRAMEVGETDSPAEQSWAGTEILRAMHRGRNMADFNVTGTQFNNNQPWKSEWERLKTLRDFATGDWGAGDSELKKKHDEDSARIAADIDAKWDAKLKERGQTGDSATRRAREMEKRVALDEFDYAEYERNKNLVDSAWQRASETLTGWMPGTLRDDAAELLYDEDADGIKALMESKKAWDEKSHSLRSAATPIAGNVAAYYAKRDELNAANEELRRFLAENPDPAASPEYRRLAEKADKRRKAAEYRSALDHESAYKNYLRLAPLMSAQARDIVEQTLKNGGAPGIWFWDGRKQDKLMADLQTLGREEKNLVAAILYDFKTPGAQTSVREAANQFMQGIGKVGQSAGWEIGSWIQRLRLSDAEYQDWRESAAALQQATGYKPRKYDWWITGAVADTFTTLGYGAAMYGTGKLAGIVTESVGGLAGMAAGTTFRNGAFAAAEWAGRARAAGDFASMMLDAMNTFENRVAAEGGDVTSPGFLAQKAAVGFAYATVEKISWEQLGRLAPVRRQQLALTFWRKLHGKGLAPTLYAMLKGTITEAAEEAMQGVMEEAFVECHLDKGGIDFRKIIRRGIEDFGESLGPMALMSGGAVARNVLTGNIRNIDQRELPALASVANSVIEKARQKKGWLATMDWEEWRRTLGQISRGYMERGGSRGRGVEYLAKIGIDDKETRDAVSKAIETVWREIGNTRGMTGEEIAGAQAQAEADMEAAAGWGDAEMAAEAQDAMNAIPAESREQAAERREQRMQDYFGGRKAKSAAEVLEQMFPGLRIEGDGNRVLWKRTIRTKDGKEQEQTLEIRREDSELNDDMINRDSPEYDAGADNDLYDIYAEAAAAGYAGGEDQRVMTREEWLGAKPEDKKTALASVGINWDDLRGQGHYSATMPDGTRIDGEAIRDFAGLLFLEEGYLPTAPVHEMGHAMVSFLEQIGALTDDDIKALSKAYGEAVAKDKNGNLIERFDEERFTNAIEMAMAGQIDLYEKTGAEKVLEKMRDAIGRVVQFFGGMEEDAFWRRARQDAMFQAVLTGDWQGIDAPKNLAQLAERHRRLEEAAKRSRQRRNKAAAPSKPQPPETTTGDTKNVQAEAGAAETGGGEEEGRGRGGESVPGGEAPAGGEAVATETGAQGEAPVAKPAKRKAPTTRYGADNKPAARGRYRIVDGKLIAEVVRNDYRPKLQPRAGSTGRETRARKEQNVVQSADLNPDLLEIDRHMREGAPTVADFLHPVAGWGRYAQITAAYAAGKGAEYRQRMRELDAEYEDMGYDESMEMPMLVFILDGMPMDELEQLAIDSNQSGVLGHTDVEQAKLDAGLVTDKVLKNLHPNENGDLRIDDNAEALFAFIDGMGAEGAKLRTEGGRPTGEAVTRLRKALLAKALEGSPIQYEVLRKAFDETAESRASRVVSGVVQGAASLATIGNDAPALDLSAEAAWALSEYFEFRELNATGDGAMENWLGQGDMFNPRPAVVETLLREFWARRLSGASVAAMLGEYAKRAKAKGADAQASLGEADAGRTKDAILKEAAEATRDAGGADRWAIGGIYTGSAADYDRPSLHYVGTGLGTAAYGWGLYGNTSEDTAYIYADNAQTEGGKPLYVYEQTFFTNRKRGDHSHLINWHKPLTQKQHEWIKDGLKKENVEIQPSSLDGLTGEAAYALLAEKLGSPKAASEFLARNDIDGIAFKESDDTGFDGVSYVSFRDDNIRVDHKWVDGVQRYAIAGPAGAARLGIGTLDEAKEIRLNGADKWQIWQRTGWYVDPDDGKWRVEVPDVHLKAEFIEWLEKNYELQKMVDDFNKRPDIAELLADLSDLEMKMEDYDGEDKEEIIKKSDQLQKEYEDRLDSEIGDQRIKVYTSIPKNVKAKTLSDILDAHGAKALFQAYPELADLPVDIHAPSEYVAAMEIRENERKIKEDKAGQYYESRPTTLLINLKNIVGNNVKKRTGGMGFSLSYDAAINHEISHAIQAIEETHVLRPFGMAGVMPRITVYGSEKAINRFRLQDAMSDARKAGLSETEIKEAGWKAYLEAPWEQEAFAVGERVALTPEQRREIPPFVTKALVNQHRFGNQADYSYAAQKAMMERMRAEDAGERPAAQGADRHAIGGVTPAEDAAYMDAVKRGDMETAQRMVREAATRKMVNPSPLTFHGTRNWGFTTFNSDIIFTSDDVEQARGYGMTDTSSAQPRPLWVDDLPIGDAQSVAEAVNMHLKNSSFRVMRLDEKAEYFDRIAKLQSDFNTKVMAETNAHPGWEGDLLKIAEEDEQSIDGEIWDALTLNFADDIGRTGAEVFENGDADEDAARASAHFAGDAYQEYQNEIKHIDDFYEKHRDEIDGNGLAWIFDLVGSYQRGDLAIDNSMLAAMLSGDKMLVSKDMDGDPRHDNYWRADDARKWLRQERETGTYALYADMGGNPLVVEGNGAYWTSIKIDAWDGKHHDTNEIAAWAIENGYTSVLFKDIIDPSKYGVSRAGNVRAIFGANNVKSADPVTYDDAGNVIPLSERFNPNKADIRWAIAVSPGRGPQYGADAYIKAIMASDALANRNRPDAEYQWMIDKLTRDGGSVEDYKEDARQILKDKRSKIAADMIAAGRPGPATRLLAQAAEENAIGSLLADAAGYGMQTGAKYGIKAAEGLQKAWNSLKFGKAALGGVDEAEQTLGIGLTSIAEATLGEADEADRAANEERRREAEANAEAAIAERERKRKEREAEGEAPDAPATESDEEREARIEQEAAEAEQKSEGVIADIEAAKRSGEFDKKDDGGAKPKDKNAGEGEKAAAEENAEAERGASGRGDDAAPPPPPRISTEALARVCKKHGLDPEDARTMMLMMRIILRNWIIQKSGGKFTKTNVFLAQENVIAYQQTMAKWLRDFARKMVDPSNGHAIRRITDAVRDIQAYDPPPPPGMSKDGVTRAIRHIDTLAARAFSMIQAQAVKDEKRAMARQLEIDIRDRRGRAKRIDDLEEDMRMKMLKDDLKMAQFLEHAIWWTPEAVAIKMREYQNMMDERAAAWAKDGMAGGEEFDTAYRYASMRMTLLAQYGGLVYRSRAEIAEARRDIIDWLDNALETHARTIEQREKAMAHAREDLMTAMRGPTTPKHAERKTAFGRALTKAGDWIVCTMRQRLDLMTERPDMTDEEREAGRRAKRKILQMIAAGSIRRSNLQFQYKNDLYAAIDAAIKGVAGMSRKKFIQHLGEKVDDVVARRISRQGNTGDAALTYGQLLNIYSYLCQTTSYAYNINKHEREGQREYLESVLPTEDLQFVAELRKLYAARFDDLSQAKMDVVGAPLTTPDPLYTPIRMYVGARGGLAPEVEGGWTPVARALWTERVPNGRDVDESRHILGLYWESSKDTANAVSFGLRGSMLRSILAHPETVEAMEWAIGKKETRRLLDHLSDTLNGEAPQGTLTTGGEIIKALNTWATYCSLAWNPFTMMKQMTSIPAWTGVLDYGSYRRIAASIANFDFKAAGELMAHPGFIARYGAETINPLKLKTLKNIWNDPNTSIRQKLGQLGMQPLQIGDLLPGLAVGTGIYKELVRKYVDEQGMDEAKAREQAGNDVWAYIEESQQSSQMQNLMEDMRRGGVISKSLWKFATSPILQASQEVQALREWRRSGWKDDEARARFWNCFVANHILMPMAIYTVNMMAAWSMAKKDPWEDWFKELVVACFIGSYGRWFLIGTGAEAFVRHLAGLQVHDNTSIPSAQLAWRLWGKAGVTFHDVMSMDFDKVGSDLLDTAAIISPAARIVRSRAKNKAKSGARRR